MAVVPPKRKNTYEVHLYLPEWMRASLRDAAEQHRWSINTSIEVAVEQWLAAQGIGPPERLSQEPSG
jgi:hypothetical protein